MSDLRLVEIADPSTPAAGYGKLYLGEDGRLRLMTSDGLIALLAGRDVRENVIINGGFDFGMRQVLTTLTTYSNTSGRSYGPDRWGMTNENASIQFAGVDTSGASALSGLRSRYYGKFKKITSAGKFVVSQVIEGGNMMPLRGRQVTLQMKLRYAVAGSMTVRIALLYLTTSGTIDQLPVTFVSAFGAAGTDPTWGTNLTAIAPDAAIGDGTISGNGITCVLTSAFLNYGGVFTVPDSAKNLVVVVFTNGQPAANDELHVGEAGLYDGVTEQDWCPRSAANELLLCQRYYQKTFNVNVAPAQNVGAGTGEIRFIAGKAGAAAEMGYWSLRVPLRSGGSGATYTTYNPAAVNAQVRDFTAAADCTAASASTPSTENVLITCTGAAGTAVGNALGVHLTIDAEL